MNTFKKLSYDEIIDNPIVLEWVTLCLQDPQPDNSKHKKEKSSFWMKNEKVLSALGFSFVGEISKAIDKFVIDKMEDLQGSLLVVKVGTTDQPATDKEIDHMLKLMHETLEGVKGVRVMVVNQYVDIQKFSLPQLRKLESDVISSSSENNSNTSITSGMEVD